MAAFLLKINRVSANLTIETGAVNPAVTTEAQVNEQLTRSPDGISVTMKVASEAQVRGLLQYAKAIDNGTDTSSVETAISAII